MPICLWLGYQRVPSDEWRGGICFCTLSMQQCMVQWLCVLRQMGTHQAKMLTQYGWQSHEHASLWMIMIEMDLLLIQSIHHEITSYCVCSVHGHVRFGTLVWWQMSIFNELAHTYIHAHFLAFIHSCEPTALSSSSVNPPLIPQCMMMVCLNAHSAWMTGVERCLSTRQCVLAWQGC
jgi:hypothetical protein